MHRSDFTMAGCGLGSRGGPQATGWNDSSAIIQGTIHRALLKEWGVGSTAIPRVAQGALILDLTPCSSCSKSIPKLRQISYKKLSTNRDEKVHISTWLVMPRGKDPDVSIPNLLAGHHFMKKAVPHPSRVDATRPGGPHPHRSAHRAPFDSHAVLTPTRSSPESPPSSPRS